MLTCPLLVCLLVVALSGPSLGRYEPNWDSLDKRPLPEWYDQSKIGIFIHWGVFSVPSYTSEWFWNYWKSGHPNVVQFMKNNYRPDFTYADFAPQFNAEFYDPNAWATLFEQSGAKYVVLVTKHHEGFCNWDTKYSFNWNSMAVGPKRDLTGDLAKAVKSKPGMHFGVYHSLFEWFNPVYLQDAARNFSTQDFVRGKTMPELYELVTKYQPDVIWSDGDAGPPEYWNSTNFLAWLYNDSPVKDTVVVNDRWGTGTACKHGDSYDCHDRYNPGKLQNHKWENCFTIDTGSWGYRRDASLSSYLSIEDILSEIVSTIACGGNALVNVGPTHDGRIMPVFEERLVQMGQWLKINGEAMYDSLPWTSQNDTYTPNVWYTTSRDKKSLYATFFKYPSDSKVELGAYIPAERTGSATLLGYGQVPYVVNSRTIVTLDPACLQSLKWAWVLKFDL